MAKRLCRHCGSGRLRRLNRKGWVQLRLLTPLGFFPWECVMCRGRAFYRDNGHGIHTEANATGSGLKTA